MRPGDEARFTTEFLMEIEIGDLGILKLLKGLVGVGNLYRFNPEDALDAGRIRMSHDEGDIVDAALVLGIEDKF